LDNHNEEEEEDYAFQIKSDVEEDPDLYDLGLCRDRKFF
jgi:hypothetical protein